MQIYVKKAQGFEPQRLNVSILPKHLVLDILRCILTHFSFGHRIDSRALLVEASRG